MFKFVRSHLQAKLTLAFVMVLLIPTVVITAYSLNSASNAVIQAAGQQELNTNTLSEDNIQNFLQNMKDDLLFLRGDAGTQEFVNSLDGTTSPTALSDIQQLFSNFLSSSSAHYKDIRVLDTNGQEVVRIDETGGTPVIVYGADLENKAARPYFQEAMKLESGQVYFSGLDLNATKGQLDNPPLPVLRYSTPLFSSGGHRVGVLVLKAFAQPLLDTLLPDDSSEITYLFDSNGDYWLNPDASKLYGTLLGTKASFSQDQPSDAAFMQNKDQGVLQSSENRPNDFQSFLQIPLEDQPGSQWTLVAVRPMSDVLADVNETRNGILIFSFFGSLVAIAVATLRAQSVVKPIRQLTAAASEISQNHWDMPLPTPNTGDEITSLADSFRSMVAAVQSRNAYLDQLNASLTAQAKELTRANAIARESVRLKSEFMSTMSHELRTPLNAILGFSGIMLEGMGGEIDTEARHMIERMDSNSQRLLHLINDILDLAKIEAGRMELMQKPFSPHQVAARWRSETSVLAEQKGLQFNVNIAADLPDTLLGDAERLTQVAVNLLSNAFKFTKTGSVTMSLERQENTWTIQVRDTGIGIPPHALNYIFDEFRQVDGTSTRVYGGSGLGLSIVRNLCRMMDGNVRVTSELGKGSVFTVTLPLRIQNETTMLDTPVLQAV